MIKRAGRLVLKGLNIVIRISGVISLIMLFFSFTDQPYHLYHWLGTHSSEITESPDYIVVMGAGGMPGAESLIRCHFAAKGAKHYPDTKVIIALPTEDKEFLHSDSYRMFQDINLKGVDAQRIMFETNGTNTFYQSKEIFNMLKEETNKNLLIVTSPEHMYRSILTFRKSGFEYVSGLPTFENSFDEDMLFMKEERSQRVKEVHRNLNFRYNMWNYLKYEIIIIREAIAILWYKLKGYI